jgi:CHAD domain-containing protein
MAAKWITDLSATTPLAKAARHVLALRLQVVRDYLPLAIHHADEDVEHVHQLRVGTRRARAALDIFECCLPKKTYRSVKRALRRIRQAAGAARDWDVFLLSLAAWKPRAQPHRAALFFLQGYGQAQREAAHLEQLQPMSNGFGGLVESCLAGVRKPRPRCLTQFVELAQPLLRSLFLELSTGLGDDLKDFERLHALRIVGKRLRYAMEVFVACFAPPFCEQIYPAVEAIQEILGQLNDHRVVRTRLESLRSRLQSRPDDWKRLRAGFEERLGFHEEQIQTLLLSFKKWRDDWQQSAERWSLDTCR